MRKTRRQIRAKTMYKMVYSVRGFRVETVQYFMALYTPLWPLLYYVPPQPRNPSPPFPCGGGDITPSHDGRSSPLTTPSCGLLQPRWPIWSALALKTASFPLNDRTIVFKLVNISNWLQFLGSINLVLRCDWYLGQPSMSPLCKEA